MARAAQAQWSVAGPQHCKALIRLDIGLYRSRQLTFRNVEVVSVSALHVKCYVRRRAEGRPGMFRAVNTGHRASESAVRTENRKCIKDKQLEDWKGGMAHVRKGFGAWHGNCSPETYCG